MSSCLTSKRTDVAFKNETGCKGTTKFSNLQDFKQKNCLCLHKCDFVCLKSWSLHQSVDVASRGALLG